MEKIKNAISKSLPPHTHLNLKRRVVFILLHAMIPLIALSFYAYLGQREHSINMAERDAGLITENVAQTYREKVKTTESILRVVSKLPEINASNSLSCNNLMTDLLKEFDSYANFGVAESDGFAYCSGVPLTERVNVKDRSWYAETVKNESFSIGTYQVGRVTGKPGVNFGYPIFTDGKISQVLFASLDLEWIKSITDNFSLPAGSVITVVDREGTVLARFPEEGGFVGTNQSDSPLVKRALENGEKGSMFEKGLDGKKRYYSYARIQESSSDGDFFLYIGMPINVLTDNANKAFAVNFAIILGIILLSGVVVIIDWNKFVDEEPTSP